jgi:hypothetical protein
MAAKANQANAKLQFPAFLGPLRSIRIPDVRIRKAAMFEVWATVAATPSAKRILGLFMQTQQNENWCWAAVVQAVLSTKVQPIPTQESIVSKHLDQQCRVAAPDLVGARVGCSSSPCIGSCNGFHNPFMSLQEQGLSPVIISNIPDPPTFNMIMTEILSNRPIVCMFTPMDNSAGHCIVISGFETDLAGHKYIYVHYPLWEGGGLRSLGEEKFSYENLITRTVLSGIEGRITWSYKTS